MASKKDLMEMFHITLVTVNETLKACGIDTSKREHTDEEVEMFRIARAIKEKEGSYDKVKEFFRMKNAQRGDTATGTNTSWTSPDEIPSEYELKEQVAKEIAGAMQEIVNAAAKDMVQYIPLMARKAFSKLVEDGAIAEAFKPYTDSVQSLPPASYGDNTKRLSGIPGSDAAYEYTTIEGDASPFPSDTDPSTQPESNDLEDPDQITE